MGCIYDVAKALGTRLLQPCGAHFDILRRFRLSPTFGVVMHGSIDVSLRATAGRPLIAKLALSCFLWLGVE
jgi:hypothetical protein